ncbi:MAG TPA: ParB/RepB/Spo0J family partition protein [Alphaproteobacteria bacterium]|nr:ParB/RepB/Spo0J family partition protein [Alphaproteobacteria bacterium]
MEEEVRRPRGLGRGLSALFGEDVAEAAAPPALKESRPVVVMACEPSPFQPRRRFDEAAIEELAESIRARGVLQPILVRPKPRNSGRYEIIAGERRWRAAQLAGLVDIPAIVRELSDQEAAEIALIENVQRQDLTPLEEAEGFKRLIDDYRYTQDELAKTIGKSRSHLANTLRLLALPDSVKGLLTEGKLTAGHARALLGAPNAELLAENVVLRGLSVRQTEQLARSAAAAEPQPRPRAGRAAQKDPDTAALERDLSARLGLKANIAQRSHGGGVLSIEYKSLDQLEDVFRRLKLIGEEGGQG